MAVCVGPRAAASVRRTSSCAEGSRRQERGRGSRGRSVWRPCQRVRSSRAWLSIGGLSPPELAALSACAALRCSRPASTSTIASDSSTVTPPGARPLHTCHGPHAIAGRRHGRPATAQARGPDHPASRQRSATSFSEHWRRAEFLPRVRRRLAKWKRERFDIRVRTPQDLPEVADDDLEKMKVGLRFEQQEMRAVDAEDRILQLARKQVAHLLRQQTASWRLRDQRGGRKLYMRATAARARLAAARSNGDRTRPSNAARTLGEVGPPANRDCRLVGVGNLIITKKQKYLGLPGRRRHDRRRKPLARYQAQSQLIVAWIDLRWCTPPTDRPVSSCAPWLRCRRAAWNRPPGTATGLARVIRPAQRACGQGASSHARR